MSKFGLRASVLLMSISLLSVDGHAQNFFQRIFGGGKKKQPEPRQEEVIPKAIPIEEELPQEPIVEEFVPEPSNRMTDGRSVDDLDFTHGGKASPEELPVFSPGEQPYVPSTVDQSTGLGSYPMVDFSNKHIGYENLYQLLDLYPRSLIKKESAESIPHPSGRGMMTNTEGFTVNGARVKVDTPLFRQRRLMAEMVLGMVLNSGCERNLEAFNAFAKALVELHQKYPHQVAAPYPRDKLLKATGKPSWSDVYWKNFNFSVWIAFDTIRKVDGPWEVRYGQIRDHLVDWVKSDNPEFTSALVARRIVDTMTDEDRAALPAYAQDLCVSEHFDQAELEKGNAFLEDFQNGEVDLRELERQAQVDASIASGAVPRAQPVEGPSQSIFREQNSDTAGVEPLEYKGMMLAAYTQRFMHAPITEVDEEHVDKVESGVQNRIEGLRSTVPEGALYRKQIEWEDVELPDLELDPATQEEMDLIDQELANPASLDGIKPIKREAKPLRARVVPDAEGAIPPPSDLPGFIPPPPVPQEWEEER